MSFEHARIERLTPPSETARALWIVLGSAVLALAALLVALRLTRPPEYNATFAAERMHGSTPERAAESFIEAYRSGAYERASHFATGALSETLQAHSNDVRADSGLEHEAFVVQESHRLEQDRLRLLGVLVREGQDESEGKSVALTLRKHDGRYLVEEIEW